MDAPVLDRRTMLVHGIAVILASSLLLGAMAVAVRAASHEMAAGQVAFVRFAGSFLILLALRGGRSLRPRGRWQPVLLRGLLGGGAIIIYYYAISGAGAGLATLVHCTYPIWTTLIATTLLHEPFDRRLVGALVLFLVGIAIVVGPGADLGRAATFGSLIALCSSLLAGGAVATARQLRLTESAYLVTTYFMAVGALLSAPALFAGLPPCTPTLLGALLAVVLTSVSGQLLLHQGLGFAPATQASLTAATAVVSAAVLEAIVLGEHLSAHTMLGAGVLVAAVGLAVSRR
ncbi:MAG: DMT family transporter [Deltaproteobacteria bacterium]|nr:DMT family transporter [Deltaproteobacteria bacterium]